MRDAEKAAWVHEKREGRAEIWLEGGGQAAEKGGQDRQFALLRSQGRQAGHVLAPELILIQGKLR